MMSRFLARMAVIAISLVIGGAAIVTAVVFLVIALYLFLADWIQPWQAALATAGLALLFAVLVFWLGSRIKPRRRSYANPGSAAELGEILGRQARTFARANKLTAVAIALMAGVAVGISPRLRAFLLGLL